MTKLLLFACAMAIATDAHALPGDDYTPAADAYIGTISFGGNQLDEVPQGDSITIPAGTIKPGTKNGKPMDVTKLANGAGAKYSAMALGKGVAFHLADAPSKAGETDTVRFEPKSGAFEFSSTTQKSIAPRLIAKHADNSVRDVTVRTRLGAKARGRFAFDGKRDVVTYRHDGGKASIDFDLGTTKRNNARLKTKALEVEAGDEVTIEPDWDHLEQGKGEIRHKTRDGRETKHSMR